jgi:hypothetical protein
MQWLAFLLRTREIRNSNLSPETGYPDGSFAQFYQANGGITDSYTFWQATTASSYVYRSVTDAADKSAVLN